MKSTMTLAAVAAAVCALTLTACGGGGGGSPTTPTPTPGTGDNGNTGGGSTLTLQYEALPTPDGITRNLNLMNQEGAKGYRYLGDAWFSADGKTVTNGVSMSGSTSSIFIRDGLAPTYAYESLASPSSIAGLVAQANAEGAKGYRYEGDYWPNTQNPTDDDLLNPATYSLYRKDGGQTTTYTYVADTVPGSDSVNDFLTQANARGQSGYVFYGTGSAPDASSSAFNFYIKNNASGARYVYEALPAASTQGDLLDHFNSEGTRGYRAKGTYSFAGQSYEIYVKDQTQSATFTWQSETPQASSAGFIGQANDLAAQGYVYFGDVVPDVNGIASASQMSLYFKASNCSGFMCTTLNGLTQN